jgi:hypothetical protein
LKFYLFWHSADDGFNEYKSSQLQGFFTTTKPSEVIKKSERRKARKESFKFRFILSDKAFYK